MEEKKKRIGYVVLALILLVVVIFILFLLNGSETRTSEPTEKDEVSALHCKAGRIEEGFFVSDTANTSNNEIKITYSGNKLDKMYYSFKGVYRSDEVANEDEYRMHAKYNIYMGENNIEQESLSPNYSVVDSKFQLSLYVDSYDKINNVTAVFFFIDKEDIPKFNTYSLDTLKSYYEKQDFECEIIK